MSEEQIVIQYHPEIDKEADELIFWAAARAGVIVATPILGMIALMANEIYMIVRLGNAYGVKITETAAAGFLMSLGASFAGKTLVTLIPLPILQVPVGVSVTYAVGRVAQAWIKAGMPDNPEELRREFAKLKDDAMKRIDEFTMHPKKDVPLGDETRKF